MQFIHSRGVMHRDLRSENVLLDVRECVRIGDLENSRLVDFNVKQTKQAGTPLYIALEIYDEEEYTIAVDVYSYGLIVYELLTGRPVFPPTIPPLVLMKKAASNERPELPA
jgi:p21-activated kinase 1